MIVNTGSGQAERSSVAERSWDLFSRRKVLDGSHEATDETTPRTTPPEVRRRPHPPRHCAGVCGGLGTVTAYLQRATAAGLTWPLPDDLDDAALEARLFARPAVPPARDRVVPDWRELHQELKKPGVTLALLWQEYRAQHPDGYAYSQFCERYRRWARALKPSMRQVHRAGEKLFVDFSGKRPHLVDPTTGEAIAGRALRRRARRERLDLRRGDAEPGSAVVGRRARPHAGLLSGQSRDLGARQSEERRHDGATATSRRSTAPTPSSPATTARW